MQKEQPLLTVFCPSFNHEKYLKQCFESILMQKTNFSFEILVHDDASSDNSQEIIKEYEKRYPDLFRCIYQSENQFLKDCTSLTRFMFDNVKSKYMALCEGDDYWTDPLKLQKQVDFLEKNIAYSACFHRYKVLNDDTDFKEDKSGFLFKNNKNNKGVDVDLELFLKHWITQPLTMVLRVSMLDQQMFKEYKFFRDIHLLYHLQCSGKFHLLDFVGGVYRLHTGGMHSKKKMQELCDIGINTSKELFKLNRNKHLKIHFLKNLEWGLNEYVNNKYSLIKLYRYILMHFYYSFSVKKLFKQLRFVFLNYRKQ